MTYYGAAFEVLRSAQYPLTTRQITERAIEMRLITPHGKTPIATMAAELYLQVRTCQAWIYRRHAGEAWFRALDATSGHSWSLPSRVSPVPHLDLQQAASLLSDGAPSPIRFEPLVAH